MVETEKKVIYNKSKTYMLPLISRDINMEFDYLLLNTFIKFNRDIGSVNYPIGLLFDLEESSSFGDYNTYLITHKLFHKSFIINESKKLYIFHFPEQFICEYKLFKEGRYSKFSNDAKSLIISFSAETYKYPPLITDITGVLYKHKSRKLKLQQDLDVVLSDDCELASKIEYDNETFKFIN